MTDTDPAFAPAEAFAASYQHWFGPATFLRAPYRPDFSETDIGIVGFPHSGGNPVEHVQYLGPRYVRNRSMSYRRIPREYGINPFEIARISDIGDVLLPRSLNPDNVAEDAQSFYQRVFAAGVTPVTIGGDHSITGPILRAARAARFDQPLAVIHFDSHNDTFPPAFGTAHHAGPFRMAAEQGVIDPAHMIQIGIRGPMGDPQMDDWSRDHVAGFVTTAEVLERGIPSVIAEAREIVGDRPTYLSFDLDVIDPTDAPAVADPETDGLRLREIMQAIRGLRGLNFMGADIVCYCPLYDTPAQTTALAASSILLHFVTLIAERLKTAA